ncbi:MAG: short-chain dehydrogenase, partial [Chitinophagaceae bacterium]|nr:short-chain dehydrogenase [Chitinophagaceae bacterium]
MSTKNKIALVTGGSRGLGKNMSLALARKGIDVILTYHSNQEAADSVVSEIQSLGQKAVAFQLDTSNINGFDNFVKQTTDYLQEYSGSPQFDFLINNAGTALYSLIAETSEQQLDSIFNIHYKAVFFLSQKFLPFLHDGGGIINVSSGLARLTFPGSSVYASMKGAVEILTRYLAKELGPRKIRV